MVTSVIIGARTHAGKAVRMELAPVNGPNGPQIRIRTPEQVLYIEKEEMADAVIAIFGGGATGARHARENK